MCNRADARPFVSTPESTAAPNPEAVTNTVPFDPQREVRFAVVMYGGVSLAIYINGVTQELLNMVRATAPKSVDPKSPDYGKALIDNDKLTGSLAVYRNLGQHLHQREKLKQAAAPDRDGKPKPPTFEPICTRFVVDVISGTSAGGINGVFLAKALSRNQGMEGLKQLWLSEGDLGKLLNDEASIQETGLALREPRQSLLNSQRMYHKLLDALRQMDTRKDIRTEKEISPLVGELDLF